MWEELSNDEKKEYENYILGFASLSQVFAQKENLNENEIVTPIVNSKFQETVFQKAFNASAEDIGNTSFDVAMIKTLENGEEKKFLIGIKTFGFNANEFQKVAQFKKNHDDWINLINKIKQNSINAKSKEEINLKNHDLYKQLAISISKLRNKRIDSSIENLRGFIIDQKDNDVESFYHVLMPTKKNASPIIYVGEIPYTKINIDNINIIGCSSINNPTNFEFTDSIHKYKFTVADSQLYMAFDNKSIIKDSWEVKYIEDAFEFFQKLAEKIKVKEEKIEKSFSWFIKVEKYSGFNSFFSVSPKSKKSNFKKKETIEKIEKILIEKNIKEADILINHCKNFLLLPHNEPEEKLKKIEIRKEIMKIINEKIKNDEIRELIMNLLWRPKNEIYIPVPNSANFHYANPDFFNPALLSAKRKDKFLFEKNTQSLRTFNLILEPSNSTVECYIAQERGKAIESTGKQTFLGEWILRKIFQLAEYEPLSQEYLDDIGINAIRIWKEKNSLDVHLKFIWLDKKNPPSDLWK